MPLAGLFPCSHKVCYRQNLLYLVLIWSNKQARLFRSSSGPVCPGLETTTTEQVRLRADPLIFGYAVSEEKDGEIVISEFWTLLGFEPRRMQGNRHNMFEEVSFDACCIDILIAAS